MLLLSILVLPAGAGGAEAKTRGPTSIAAGYGFVWVGTANGDVLALPLSLDRVERPLPRAPMTFVHGLNAAYGALWILRDQVTRIDLRRNAARNVPETASDTASGIAAGAGAVWIADDGSNTILRIDPRTVGVRAWIAVPGRLWTVAAGSNNVVVVSVPTRGPVRGPRGVRLLRRLDPKTNRLSPPLVRLGCDVGVAVGSRAVWTFDACTRVLARRNPRTLRVERQKRIDVLPQVPALAFGAIWLASPDGTLRINSVTIGINARIAGPGVAVTVGSGFVWALDTGGTQRAPSVRRIDAGTSRVTKATTLSARS